MYRKLFLSIRENKKQVYLTFIYMTLEALVQCLLPFVTARLINKLQRGQIEMSGILQEGFTLFVLSMVALLFGFLGGISAAKASAGFAENLRSDIFKKIQTFSFSNIDRFSSASLITRMTSDVRNIQFAFMMVIRTAIRAPLMMVISFVLALYMGGKLAWSFFLIIPFLAISFFLISKLAMPVFRRVFKRYDNLNRVVEENVRACREVKGFSREEYEIEKFTVFSDAIRKDFTKAEKIVNLNSPIMQLAIYFNMVFVLIVGSYIAVSSGGVKLNVGEMSAMITYGFQIMIQLIFLTMILVLISISGEGVRRLNEILDEEIDLKSPENPIYELDDGSIDFKNVSFKYSEEAENEALKNINLHIDSGMTVGIVGGTGSGKSTLIQLIPRLYDITQGSLKVGGHDVREYDLKALRNEVSIVLQKNLIFSGTVAENLRWGDPGAGDEDLVMAAKIAQADSFIRDLPEGYDSIIEQGGSNVSGGQKQRLTIARALLKKPKILILDDSTSAVDTRTDRLIREGLKKSLPGTTKLIIAQRIASIADADFIVVMKDGRISDIGKHEELMERNEEYRNTADKQGEGKIYE